MSPYLKVLEPATLRPELKARIRTAIRLYR